ncbi:hypothetical protein IWX84_001652 [Flavobacterium sp. CG_9.10]|uniref:vanadium-dependent haloperoxidase n=1 Tax=Flavobacterium sp. CG_9.10 TaxID=2787729 RepID=UPI0018C8DD51|nr:vanadium-dependent haloperoxidase [Flavobacterium sp. CG_9.10]MBG6110772.1 hypothetical protein [Flavobacterium sp. CG_9.10]
MKNYLKQVMMCFVLFLVFISCTKEDILMNNEDINSSSDKKIKESGFVENNMVMYWNEKTATVLGAPMTQPSRTRYFAIIQIAVHDALNNIKPKYERFALNEREKFASPDAAVASAAYWTIKGLNRQGIFPVDTWYAESLATIPDGESKELGKILGKKSADAIIANRANDGFTQVIQVSLTPLDGDEPGEFRSPIMYLGGVLNYLQPPVKRIANWGIVMRTYVIKSNQQFRPAGPYAVSSTDYGNDYNEVKAKGARVNSTRTETETSMARFWSENRPSITWNNFTREAIKTKKMDAWKTARLFALMHVSLAESVNSGLNAMYHYYYWRPETAIRLAATDGNNSTDADSVWLPFLNEVPNTFPTPPQPGYPSSITAYGGTAAEVLRLFFASNETDIYLTSATLPGNTMHFTTFAQVARDNSLSMIYTGWEFRKSAIDGEEMGRNVGNYVFNNHFRENSE